MASDKLSVLMPTASGESATISFRWRVIQEILGTPQRSYQRGLELRRAHLKWAVPIRTMQRWVSRFETSEGNVNSLARSRQAKVCQRRVWVSRQFDRAYHLGGYDPALLQQLRATVDQLIRAAWASPAQRAGWQQVRREVVCAFARHLRELLICVPEHEIRLSQRRIREARYFRIVDVREHDRKMYDDQRPRIRRANNQLLPMQQIVMDVKVVDCAVRRDDGSVAWPRMIAFMDTGTQRIFRRFFLLNPGEGIRQEHVAATFLEMISDPNWGFPQQLYRDNGAEFFILDLIRHALQQLQESKVPTIINARPYSAASKPIESKFAALDRFVFSQLGGWSGGDRMRKKTAHLGRPPVPYGGSFAEFVRDANERIQIFESLPISSGPFSGKSPVRLIEEHALKGWRPLLVPVERVDAAFCTRDRRRISRGCVSITGEKYRHPSLINGQTVTVAMPWRRGAAPLAQVPEEGWVRLEPDRMFAPTDIAGARASDQRRREHDAAVRQLKRRAGHIDLKENHRERLAASVDKLVTPAVHDRSALPDERSLGEALASSPVAAPAGVRAFKETKQSQTEELEAYLASRRPNC